MENSQQPAFPLGQSENLTWNSDINDAGLTKKEYFAGLAMQGLLACNAKYEGKTDNRNALAKDAILFADALLKELDNTKQHGT